MPENDIKDGSESSENKYFVEDRVTRSTNDKVWPY